jgi:hypothetical protein
MNTFEEFARAYSDALRGLWTTPEHLSNNVGRVCVVIARKPNPEFHKRKAELADLERTYAEWLKDYREELTARLRRANAPATH